MLSHSKLFLALALAVGSIQLIVPQEAFAAAAAAAAAAVAEDGEVVAGLEVAGLEAAGLEAGDFEGADSAAGVSAAGSRGGGFEGGGYQGGWGSGYRGGFTGDRGGFESGNVGGYPREATVSRGPVSPGWRGNELRGDRFNRFRRGEYGGYGGWGYWLGDDYWGFYSPWWFGGFPFWYSDLGSADYSNPYYDMNPVDYGNYDYGVPIQQASAEPSPEEGPSFTAAREAFKAGNYQEALNDIKQAIVSEPQSQDIHEFHAADFVRHGRLSAGGGGRLRRVERRSRLGLDHPAVVLSVGGCLHAAIASAGTLRFRAHHSGGFAILAGRPVPDARTLERGRSAVRSSG